LPMEVFSAIARMDLLSDNQMKKARSKLTFVPQDWPSRHPRFAQRQNQLARGGRHDPDSRRSLEKQDATDRVPNKQVDRFARDDY